MGGCFIGGKIKGREAARVRCPVCGYEMPISYKGDAECDGVTVPCKGRGCHAVFNLKIINGKQVK